MQIFYDVDSLRRKRISFEELELSVAESCVLFIVLDAKVLDSVWCRKEWEFAHQRKVPIVLVYDTDKYTKVTIEEIKENINKQNMNYVAEARTIEYSATYRENATLRLASTIKELIYDRNIHGETG